ncbi:hypothetical protein ASZ90_015540 [hydrocarbon metagenome]|uniref:Uncharacterized protein n=1 Tax=hydrocarbon metagenome TaxID=938273 RepID=A0A0W8F252_9ZZZZ
MRIRKKYVPIHGITAWIRWCIPTANLSFRSEMGWSIRHHPSQLIIQRAAGDAGTCEKSGILREVQGA